MPKLKSHKGISKRFRKTGTGKIMNRKSGGSHFLEKKSSKRKRKLAVLLTLDGTVKKRIVRAAPYLK